MTENEARSLMERGVKAFNANESLEAGISKDFVGHGTRGSYDLRGANAKRPVDRGSFSDLQMKWEFIFCSEDLIGFRYAYTGTHDGIYRGKAPTGNRFEAWGMAIFRIKDGKVIEEWDAFDELSLLRQLGIGPEVSQEYM